MHIYWCETPVALPLTHTSLALRCLTSTQMHCSRHWVISHSDWNLQNGLQAIACTHRTGQNPHVSVYRFVIKDTMGDELECAKKMVIGARVCE